jgi:transcription initiation factor IIE alpha subunit
MEDTRQYFECEGCGAEYSLHTDMEDIVAEFCPFCSEPLDEIDWEYDDENTKQEGEGS